MLEREVYVEYQKYKDTQFGGWIYKYMSPEQSSILINNNNPPTRMLFVLYHELIHWFFHPPEKEYCDYFHIKSTNIIEYQANEGAAEMLVPHKVFIPWVASYLKNRELSFEEIMEIKRFATDEFHVSPAIIYYRLESLKYEIQQYVNGVDIDALEYLSNRRLAERNIRVQSLNDREWLLRRGYVA
jgi:Zn-dependent peptidase ImmA (M78 family)